MASARVARRAAARCGAAGAVTCGSGRRRRCGAAIAAGAIDGHRPDVQQPCGRSPISAARCAAVSREAQHISVNRIRCSRCPCRCAELHPQIHDTDPPRFSPPPLHPPQQQQQQRIAGPTDRSASQQQSHSSDPRRSSPSSRLDSDRRASGRLDRLPLAFRVSLTLRSAWLSRRRRRCWAAACRWA